MAPEQRAGREVTVRSDLYALGLVLYEMFTGKRAFMHGRAPADRPPRIDTVVKDIDVAVARTIERCIELAPRDRPASSLEVAASLPGGNPLAEALAAGLTPSPQMVAAARSYEALPVRAAVLALTGPARWSGRRAGSRQPHQPRARHTVSVPTAGARTEGS